MSFRHGFGRFGYWGDEDPGSTSTVITKPTPGEVIQTAIPAVSTLITSLQDPRRQAGVLRAKLQAAIARGDGRQAAILRAKYEATIHQIALTREGEGATRQWRGLGQAAILTGIGVGFALIVLLLALARKKGGA